MDLFTSNEQAEVSAFIRLQIECAIGLVVKGSKFTASISIYRSCRNTSDGSDDKHLQRQPACRDPLILRIQLSAWEKRTQPLTSQPRSTIIGQPT